GRRVGAGHLPAPRLGTPEATGAEHGRLHAVGEGRLEGVPVDVVPVGHLHRLFTTRQRLLWIDHRQPVSSKPHFASPVVSRTSQHQTPPKGSRTGGDRKSTRLNSSHVKIS